MKRLVENLEMDHNFQKINQVNLTEQEYEESLQLVLMAVEQEKKRTKYRFIPTHKAVIVIVAFVFSLPILFFSGIVDFQSSNEGKDSVIQPAIDNREEDKEEIVLKAENTTQEGIQAVLNDANIVLYEWSPKNSHVAFTTVTKESDHGQLYIWQVGEPEPKSVKEVNDLVLPITAFYWSPDSQKVVISAGTPSVQWGYVVSSDSLSIVGQLSLFSQPVWSSDSTRIAMSVVNPAIIPEIEKEMGAADLAIYDVTSNNMKTVLPASIDYYYVPRSWEDEQVLVYKKIYFDQSSEEELSIDISTLSSRTARLNHATINGDKLKLEITYTEKVSDPNTPNGFRLEESEGGTIINVGKDIPIYLLKDPSFLIQMDWDEIIINGAIMGLLQIYENDGEVFFISEIYIP
ncbi:TolB-like translocation protein [Sutcliffiella halmapala]|uniref:hypothetical protein n=1 Tax=Sutcliffiella halmapala TaxID=79882 RepID=UPI000995B109|nr:hypothetical protein [Sutcliffiella halmapala]